jgi:hypothetical protein
LSPVDAIYGLTEMEYDTVRLVQIADELAQFGAENSFHRDLFRRYNLHFDAACRQRSSNFQTDEACANDNHLLRIARSCDDRFAVGK